MSVLPTRAAAALVMTTVLAGASALAIASPAFAAPPSNDLFAGATPVTQGFAEDLDTSEATTDADDQSANFFCGAPALDASVWYDFEATTEGGVVVDVAASDYSAGVIVVVGGPGSFDLITCGPSAVAFFAAVGTTYHVLAFDFQGDGGGNGGTLSISFGEAPPPPTLEVTIDPVGTFHRNGTATLTGTFRCENADFVEVFGDVTQTVGRFKIRGFFGFFEEGGCDGTVRAWSALLTGENGTFKGGKALTVVFSFACGPLDCEGSFAEQTVMLRGR